MRGFPSLPRGAETPGTRPALAPSRAASAPYSRARPGRAWRALSCTDVVLPAARSPGSQGIDRPLRPVFHQGKWPGTRRQGLRGGLGSESQRNSPAVLPGGWDSLHVAHPSRLRRKDSDERGRCPTGSASINFSEVPSPPAGRRAGALVRRKTFLYVSTEVSRSHYFLTGWFRPLPPPFPQPPPDAHQISRNLLLPGVHSPELARLKFGRRTPFPAPSLRSPLIGSGRKSPFVRYACREGRGC